MTSTWSEGPRFHVGAQRRGFFLDSFLHRITSRTQVLLCLSHGLSSSGMVYALWMSLSSMASASVGSRIASCQCLTCSCAAMSVDCGVENCLASSCVLPDSHNPGTGTESHETPQFLPRQGHWVDAESLGGSCSTRKANR